MLKAYAVSFFACNTYVPTTLKLPTLQKYQTPPLPPSPPPPPPPLTHHLCVNIL